MSIRERLAGMISPSRDGDYDSPPPINSYFEDDVTVRQDGERVSFEGQVTNPYWNIINTRKLTQPYRQHPVIHAVCRAIGRNIGQLPFEFWMEVDTTSSRIGFERFQERRYRGLNKDLYYYRDPDEIYKRQEIVKVYEGQMVDLFNFINPESDPYSFWEVVALYLMLNGESDIIMEGREDENDVPTELWPNPPEKFRVDKWTPGGLPLTWKYQSGGGVKLIPDVSLLRPRIPNPYNSLRGLAPLDAAILSAENDWDSMLFNKAFYKNFAQ